MASIQFATSTGRYLVSTVGAQRLIRGLEAFEDENADALVVSAMLKDNLAGTVPIDVILTPDEVGAVVFALEEMMGNEPLSEELYSLRDGLLREPQ